MNVNVFDLAKNRAENVADFMRYYHEALFLCRNVLACPTASEEAKRQAVAKADAILKCEQPSLRVDIQD